MHPVHFQFWYGFEKHKQGAISFVFQVGLLEWRETLAKLRDENPQSIVNPVLLLRIANKVSYSLFDYFEIFVLFFKAPRTWGELQSLANPLPRIIHEKAIDILEIVKVRKSILSLFHLICVYMCDTEKA